MPSRSPSYSPEDRTRKKKSKYRSRSRSPRSYDKHRSKHRNRSPDEYQERHKKHKQKKRYSRDPSSSPETETRKRVKQEKSDKLYDKHAKVKQEKQDRGYDKYDTVPSRWENEEDQRRPIKNEPRSDSDSDDSPNRRGTRRPVKQEADSDDDRRRRNNRDRGDRRRDERDRIRREDREERRQHDQRRRDKRNRQGGNPFAASEDDNFQFGDQEDSNQGNKEEPEKEKPNLGLSGKLTEDTNTYKGVVIKYNEPPEAKKPKKRWRLYPFKGDEALPVLHIHRQSAYLLGRDRRIADIPVDHPSCSKQHAVLQFRAVPFTRADGSEGRRVRPYVIDLGSANGTYVNNQRIDAQRYVELMEKDVVKFGYSSREYVILTDKADTTEVEEEGQGEQEND